MQLITDPELVVSIRGVEYRICANFVDEAGHEQEGTYLGFYYNQTNPLDGSYSASTGQARLDDCIQQTIRHLLLTVQAFGKPGAEAARGDAARKRAGVQLFGGNKGRR